MRCAFVRSAQRLRRALADRRGGAEIYVLAMILIGIAAALTVAYSAVQSVNIARAAMTRAMQVALQQTADQLGAVDAVSGAQGVQSAPVQALFQEDLAAQLRGTRWATMPVTVDSVQVFGPSQVGQPAPPGVLGGVVPNPGVYAEVSFPWQTGVPGLPPVTVTVPEWMSANVFVQPTPGWNPSA